MSLSDQWNEIVNSSGLSDRMIFTIGVMVTHIITFWTLNFFLFLCYKFNWFPRQRIQPGESPSHELWNAAVFHCLKNQFILQPIGLYFIYPVFEFMGMHVRGALPSYSIVFRDLLVSIFACDTVFYWSHRLLHHKLLYKYFHKQHHQFNVPIGIASEFAHPLEDLISNLMPTLSGCFHMGSHVTTLYLWIAIRIWKTVDTHSGYSFEWTPFAFIPFNSPPDKHDFHHSHNVGCYGNMSTFWDTIMGTDQEYREYKAMKEAERKERIARKHK